MTEPEFDPSEFGLFGADERTEWKKQIEGLVDTLEEIRDSHGSADAQAWAESALETVESIGEWLRSKGAITDNQQTAIENIEAAAERWTHR